MKKFAPEMEIVRFHAEDVLATSGGIVGSTKYEWNPNGGVDADKLVYWDGKKAYVWQDYANIEANKYMMPGDSGLTAPSAYDKNTTPGLTGKQAGWYHVNYAYRDKIWTAESCDDMDKHFTVMPNGQ